VPAMTTTQDRINSTEATEWNS